MRAVVIASSDGTGGLLLKRPLGETLIARAVRIAAESALITTVHGTTGCPEYAEQFEALGVLPCEPLNRLGAEPLVCIDAHYPMLSSETVEKALEFARTLSCPVQSLAPVAEHPALSFEVLEIAHLNHRVASPEYSFEIDLSATDDPETIYWINVVAFNGAEIVGSGWTELSMPTYQHAFAGAQPASGAANNGFAAEIMVEAVVEKIGGSARIISFWTSPEGADTFYFGLFRTTKALVGRAKQYTIPGLMHSDPLSGCLVDPAAGVKLINRQALPPLMERTEAVVAGGACDVADIIAGKRPRALRGLCLSEEEATCVRHELDIIRVRQKLISQTRTRGVSGVVHTRREQP